jgi:hypothetical protein
MHDAMSRAVHVGLSGSFYLTQKENEMQIKLTFEALPIVAVLLVLAAWYIPKFKDWYGGLKSESKQLFMAGAILVVILGVVGLSALGFVNIYTGPTWREWVWYPLVDFVIGIMINAGVYKGTNYMLGPKT